MTLPSTANFDYWSDSGELLPVASTIDAGGLDYWSDAGEAIPAVSGPGIINNSATIGSTLSPDTSFVITKSIHKILDTETTPDTTIGRSQSGSRALATTLTPTTGITATVGRSSAISTNLSPVTSVAKQPGRAKSLSTSTTPDTSTIGAASHRKSIQTNPTVSTLINQSAVHVIRIVQEYFTPLVFGPQTLSRPTTPGTMLLAYVTSISVAVPTFDLGAGWLPVTGVQGTSFIWNQLFYYPQNPGGITSVSVNGTWESATLTFYEVQFEVEPSGIDQIALGSTPTPGTVFTVGSITPSRPAGICFSFYFCYSDRLSGWLFAPGFTGEVTGSGNGKSLSEYFIFNSTIPITPWAGTDLGTTYSGVGITILLGIGLVTDITPNTRIDTQAAHVRALSSNISPNTSLPGNHTYARAITTSTTPNTVIVSVRGKAGLMQTSVLSNTSLRITGFSADIQTSPVVVTALTAQRVFPVVISTNISPVTTFGRIIARTAAIGTGPQVGNSIETSQKLRIIPQAALLAVPVRFRIIPQTVLLTQTRTRPIPQAVLFRTPTASTIPQQVTLRSTSVVTIPQVAALAQTFLGSRSIPLSVQLAQTTRGIRTIPQVAVFQQATTGQRTISQSVTLQQQTTSQRTILQTATFQQQVTGTRTIPQTASFQTIVTGTRTVSQAAVFLSTPKRAIPQTVQLPGIRRIPQTVQLAVWSWIWIPQSIASLRTSDRVVTQHVVLGRTNVTRTITMSIRTGASYVRTISQIALLGTVTSSQRAVPQHAKLQTVNNQRRVRQHANLSGPSQSWVISSPIVDTSSGRDVVNTPAGPTVVTKVP